MPSAPLPRCRRSPRRRWRCTRRRACPPETSRDLRRQTLVRPVRVSPRDRAAVRRCGAAAAPEAAAAAGRRPRDAGTPLSRRRDAGRAQGADRRRRHPQHLRDDQRARNAPDAGGGRRERQGRHREAAGDARHRHRADGHHDARHGRLRHDARHPRHPRVPLAAHRRGDGQGDEGRPREVHRGRRLGLPAQAGRPPISCWPCSAPGFTDRHRHGPDQHPRRRRHAAEPGDARGRARGARLEGGGRELGARGACGAC